MIALGGVIGNLRRVLRVVRTGLIELTQTIDYSQHGNAGGR
jgi:hypothetical protein